MIAFSPKKVKLAIMVTTETSLPNQTLCRESLEMTFHRVSIRTLDELSGGKLGAC
jgi:hypothetical protein